MVFFIIRVILVSGLLGLALRGTAAQPNVLFIAVDDLNHYAGFMGRNSQAKTPNIDRLAARGAAFTRAYCTAPACNPSRASVMSGIRPSTSGMYVNSQRWQDFIAEGQGLNHHFRKHGYSTIGMGKIYHEKDVSADYPSGWDAYPPVQVDLNGSKGKDRVKKFEAYFTPLIHDLADEDLGDWHTVNFVMSQLKRAHEEPFFLACGLWKPHLPFVVPKKYYDLFPLDQIELPPHERGDWKDIPTIAHQLHSSNEDHKQMLRDDRWKAAIQSYLAAMAYADMNIGRLIDALDASPYADNTVIVLWSDHGWHLGEKQKWRKFTLWEEATRTPLICVAPGVTEANTVISHPIDFTAIYPTLCELAGLPIPEHVEGKSLVPLLRDPDLTWNSYALTTHGYMNHAVRTRDWRYIRYSDGSEELYDHRSDPYEYNNLVGNPEYTDVIEKHMALLPSVNAPYQRPVWSEKGKKKK